MIGHPPPNLAMPKEIKPLELEGMQPMKPWRVLKLANLTIYYKQDDKYDKPVVEMRCKIGCGDCDFPNTTESLLFTVIWSAMFSESQRESNYMAELAGITASIEPR